MYYPQLIEIFAVFASISIFIITIFFVLDWLSQCMKWAINWIKNKIKRVRNEQ